MSTLHKHFILVGSLDTVEVTIKVFSEDNEFYCYSHESTDAPLGESSAPTLRKIEISPRNESCIGHIHLQALPNHKTRILFSAEGLEDNSSDRVNRFAEYCSKLLNYLVMGGFIQVYLDSTGSIGFKTPDTRTQLM